MRVIRLADLPTYRLTDLQIYRLPTTDYRLTDLQILMIRIKILLFIS